MEPILHLSMPVSDLSAATRFYVDVLGCERGRAGTDAADVWFFGLQLTLQHRPEEVPSDPGKRHFGATLDADHLAAVCARVEAHGGTWLRGPTTRHEGTPLAETKAYLADPSGNVIELKSYADLTATLRSTAGGFA